MGLLDKFKKSKKPKYQISEPIAILSPIYQYKTAPYLTPSQNPPNFQEEQPITYQASGEDQPVNLFAGHGISSFQNERTQIDKPYSTPRSNPSKSREINSVTYRVSEKPPVGSFSGIKPPKLLNQRAYKRGYCTHKRDQSDYEVRAAVPYQGIEKYRPLSPVIDQNSPLSRGQRTYKEGLWVHEPSPLGYEEKEANNYHAVEFYSPTSASTERSSPFSQHQPTFNTYPSDKHNSPSYEHQRFLYPITEQKRAIQPCILSSQTNIHSCSYCSDLSRFPIPPERCPYTGQITMDADYVEVIKSLMDLGIPQSEITNNVEETGVMDKREVLWILDQGMKAWGECMQGKDRSVCKTWLEDCVWARCEGFLRENPKNYLGDPIYPRDSNYFKDRVEIDWRLEQLKHGIKGPELELEQSDYRHKPRQEDLKKAEGREGGKG